MTRPSISPASLRKFQELKFQRPNLFYKAGKDDLPPEERMALQFHTSRHTIRAMFPGNGAGKTTAMAVEADWWLQHTHRYQHIQKVPKWPISAVWFTLKYAQFEEIREQLESVCFTRGWKWNEQKKRYQWPNGGRLTVWSADGDWLSAQGINPDLCLFDENAPVKMWREMQMRRRGRKKTRFVIAATATQGLTWMYTDVYKKWLEYHEQKGLSEDQAMRQQLHPYIWCWPKGGLEDNPGADEEDRQWYEEQVQYGSPAEKAVRRRGGFLDFNATPVFEPEGVTKLEEAMLARAKKLNVPKDGITGTLEITNVGPDGLVPRDVRPKVMFVPSGQMWRGGRITVYEPPRDANYGMGADMGWGLETSDYSTISVFRRQERPGGGVRAILVAEAEGRWAQAPFAWLLYAMGWYYREALLVGERNNGGLDCLRRLYDEMGYIRQWFHRDDEHKSPKPSDLIGYTRGRLEHDRTIMRLGYFIAPFDDAGNRLDPQIEIRSPQTITQLRRYQWRPRSKAMELAQARDGNLIMGAPDGEHDDLVLSTAYGLMAVVEVPRFDKQRQTFAPGSLGDILRHADVLDPPTPRKSVFSQGGRK